MAVIKKQNALSDFVYPCIVGENYHNGLLECRRLSLKCNVNLFTSCKIFWFVFSDYALLFFLFFNPSVLLDLLESRSAELRAPLNGRKPPSEAV